MPRRARCGIVSHRDLIIHGESRTLTREEQNRPLHGMLEMGDMVLDCGAEVSRVEDTLIRMGKACGAEHAEVFVITAIISVTLAFPDGEAGTETRRVHSGGTDFYRPEKRNASAAELRKALMKW